MSQEKRIPQKIAEREVNQLLADYKNFTLMQKEASEKRLAALRRQTKYNPFK